MYSKYTMILLLPPNLAVQNGPASSNAFVLTPSAAAAELRPHHQVFRMYYPSLHWWVRHYEIGAPSGSSFTGIPDHPVQKDLLKSFAFLWEKAFSLLQVFVPLYDTG